jgi:peptidoglycan hydrolase-like protein with peptidoglycan-binding domain
MIPIIVMLGAAGAAGYALYKAVKKPGKEDYQTMSVTTSVGVPVTVATPVSHAVTVAQVTATPPVKPPTVGKPPPVPTTVPGAGVTYAPPGTITLTASTGTSAAQSNSQVLQPPPIVVTPSGAASIAVGTVKDVQHALNTLGMAKPPLDEDGKIGPKTIAAIKAFQSKLKLAVDGNAGPATKAALSAALTSLAGGASPIGATVQNSRPETGVAQTPNGTVINTTAALAMSNKDIQHALNVLGTSPKLDEDDKLGPKSVAAIKTFQTAHGLTPDGIAGAKTKTALQLAIAQKR